MSAVERPLDRAVVKRALPDAEAQAAGHERLRTSNEDVVELAAGLTPDRENIFESFGCEQRGARALAFKQRVRCDCRSVDDFLYRGRVEPRDSFHDGFIGLPRRGKLFENFNASVADNGEVREGSARIDAYSHLKINSRDIKNMSGGNSSRILNGALRVALPRQSLKVRPNGFEAVNCNFLRPRELRV